MPTGLNRALQVRTAERLRAELPREETSWLPVVGALTESDGRELADVGGGRLAAIALCIETSPPFMGYSASDRGLLMHEVARLVDDQVRRTDLLGWLSADTLLVLAPGLDDRGAHALAARLCGLVANRQVDVDGSPAEMRIRVGAASRSHPSPAGWTIHALAAEARAQATAALAVAPVA